MAQVIPFPLGRSVAAARSTASSVLSSAESLGLTGWVIDDWGRDDVLASVAMRVGGMRWRAEVGGAERIPKRGPALIVMNSRRFALAPWFVSLALSRAIGRPVRFVGRPDTAPVGALARRLGGLLARRDEVAGALRHGQVLVLGASGELSTDKVGRLDHRLIAPAVEAGAPILPAATLLSLTTREARVEITRPMKASAKRRGPLAELELTARIVERIEQTLTEFGDDRTGTPLDWLPFRNVGVD